MKKYIPFTIIGVLLVSTLWGITQKAPEQLCASVQGKEAQQECFEETFMKRAVASDNLGLCTRSGSQQKYCIQNILQTRGVRTKSITPCEPLTLEAEKKHCQKGIVENLNKTTQTQDYCRLLEEEVKNETLSCKTETPSENKPEENSTPNTPETITEEDPVEKEKKLLSVIQKTKNITFCAHIGNSDLQITCVTEILKNFPEEKDRSIGKDMKKNYCDLENKGFTEEQKKQLQDYAPLTALCRLL
jgi:hypothetical protein